MGADFCTRVPAVTEPIRSVWANRGLAAAILAVCTLLLSGLVVAPSGAQQAEPYTIVVLPDTQSYLNRDFPGRDAYFADQVDWAIAQQSNRNIVFVSHVGDVVERSQNQVEWDLARPIFDRLDRSGIPFGVAAGNHDMLFDATSPAFDSVLPSSRFADDEWYRGGFENNLSSYQVVRHDNNDLLFLHVRFLRYGSQEATLDWARQVLAEHADHLAFVTVHEFGGADGNVISFNRRFRDEALSPSCNVAAVFSGHIHDQSRGTFTDQCGRVVPYMLSNYQHWENGGSGFLRSYRVDPATMRLDATSYSPTLDRALTDDANSFSVQLARPAGAEGQPQTLIAHQSDWRYFADGAPPTNWHTSGFDDAAWPLGTAQLGFGDGDEKTTIDAFEPGGQRVSAAYFRTSFELDGLAGVTAASIELLADDGAVVWLNGQRVVNDNMPTSIVTNDTPSLTGRWGGAEATTRTFELPPAAFVQGTNTVAVEVHQRDRSSSDLSFSASVRATRDDAQPSPIPAPTPTPLPTPTPVPGPVGEVTTIDFGSTWNYFDRGPAPQDWNSATFSAVSWSQGQAPLGFGDGDETTEVANRVDGNGLFTAYFRNQFTIAEGTTIDDATIALAADDGAVVWVNGQRVVNDNMTTGPVAYDTVSVSGRWGSSERQIRSFTLPASAFQNGTNTVAVEVHQREQWSSDLRFDAQLILTLS